MPQVSAFFDCAEPRPLLGMLNVPIDGLLLDRARGSDWWQCPVTRMMLPAPLPCTPEWPTTFTGDYARLPLSAFTVPTPGDWIEHERAAAGDYYLETSSGEKATTTADMAANQPMYVSVYVPGVESAAQQEVLVCGWGVQGEAGSVWLRLRADGSTVIYKGAEPVGFYDAVDSTVLSQSIKPGSQSQATATINLLLMPCRRVSLVVVSSRGAGFEHLFADLDPTATDNTITPAGPFWFYVSEGRASVQVAKVHFKESATLYSVLHTLRFAPPSGATFEYALAYDQIGPATATCAATASLTDDGGSAFTPDGSATQVRVKVAFTGDGDGVIGFYAADAYRYPTIGHTADAEFDATTLLTGLDLSVGPDGVCTGSLTLFDPGGLATAGLEQAGVTGNRPIRIAISADPDPIDLLRGTAHPPAWDYPQGKDADAAIRLTYAIVDRSQDLADCTLQAYPPLDDDTLSNAFARLLRAAAFDTADTDIETDALRLPYFPSVSSGDWALSPERGDTVGKWLDKLHSDYAITKRRGWTPSADGYRWACKARDGAVVLTLYDCPEDAVAAGVSTADLEGRVIYNYRSQRKRAEANQVVVLGQNPRTYAPVISQWDDPDAQDPTTAPADRPENWAGKVLTVTHTNPAIRTQAAADRARDYLASRVGVALVPAEWESTLLTKSDGAPVWVGDRVRLVREGGESYIEALVVAIPSISWLGRDAGGIDHWRCTYSAEVVDGTTPSADSDAFSADTDDHSADEF